MKPEPSPVARRPSPWGRLSGWEFETGHVLVLCWPTNGWDVRERDVLLWRIVWEGSVQWFSFVSLMVYLEWASQTM